jgi:hypothetical protein
MRNPRPEPGARDSSGTDELLPSNASVSTKSRAPNQAHRNGTATSIRCPRAKFARRMVFSEFGYRYARALDYDNFRDRKPGELPRPATRR